VRLLVRTWNVFHGRTVPETRSLRLEEMIRLVTAGEPDLVCLQEVPVWALGRLSAWSGMSAVGAVAMPPLGGPLGRRLSDLEPRLLRAALCGQGNAVLVRRGLRIEERRRVVLNPLRFRRTEARRLRLSRRAELVWGLNRRVAQLVRVGTLGRSLLAVNVHLTADPDHRLAEAELRAVLALVDEARGAADSVLLCGDLNLEAERSALLRDLPARGFSAPGPGIDHVLARGLELVREPALWPEERRRRGRFLLSDHAPVEGEAMIRP